MNITKITVFAILMCASGCVSTSNTPVSQTSPVIIVEGLSQDGGTSCFKFRADGKETEFYIDGRIDSTTRGDLYLNAYPESPGSRVADANDKEIIDQIMKLHNPQWEKEIYKDDVLSIGERIKHACERAMKRNN